jgi:hypothetical protein
VYIQSADALAWRADQDKGMHRGLCKTAMRQAN